MQQRPDLKVSQADCARATAQRTSRCVLVANQACDPSLTARTDSSATSKTLAIPELLEQILIRLDIRTLHIVQRVCKTWRSALQSKSLQRRMFRIHDSA